MYRAAAFKHWKNLTFLGLGALAGVLFSPAFLVLTAVCEFGILWVLPDISRFQQWVDEDTAVARLHMEREFYVKQLFEVVVKHNRDLFVSSQGDRISAATWDYFSGHASDRATYKTFVELVGIVDRLVELSAVRRSTAAELPLERVEQSINGWLRLLYASENLSKAIERASEEKLWGDVERLKAEIAGANPTYGAVLKERLRQTLGMLKRIPKLMARRELYLARADAVVDSLRQVGDAATADQSGDVTSLTEGLVDNWDFLDGDLAALSAENDLRESLGEIDWNEELKPVGQRKALSPPMPDDLSRLEEELRNEYARIPASSRR